MNARAIFEYNVSRETLERLETYVAILIKWNRILNLVSRSTVDDIWTRHILDSAQFAWMAEANCSTWADIGSGAGLPGLIVAICLAERNPEARVTLIEKDERKAAFLSEAACACDVNVIVEQRRLDPTDRPDQNNFDVVSARALAPLTNLLALAAPLLGTDGVCLFAKGRDAAKEIAMANRLWKMDLLSQESLTDPRSVILSVRNLRRV